MKKILYLILIFSIYSCQEKEVPLDNKLVTEIGIEWVNNQVVKDDLIVPTAIPIFFKNSSKGFENFTWIENGNIISDQKEFSEIFHQPGIKNMILIANGIKEVRDSIKFEVVERKAHSIEIEVPSLSELVENQSECELIFRVYRGKMLQGIPPVEGGVYRTDIMTELYFSVIPNSTYISLNNFQPFNFFHINSNFNYGYVLTLKEDENKEKILLTSWSSGSSYSINENYMIRSSVMRLGFGNNKIIINGGF